MSPQKCHAQRTLAWVLLPKRKRRPLHSSPPYGRRPLSPRPSRRNSWTPLCAPTHDLSRLGDKWRGQGREIGAKRWVLESAAIAEGSEKWSRRCASRVGAPVTATCRIAADRKLGVGGRGPLGGPPPDSHPVGSTRGKARDATCEANAAGAGPAQSRRRPLASPPAPAPPPALPRAYLGQPQPPPPRSRAPATGATGATGAPLQRLLLRLPLSPWSSPRSESGSSSTPRAPGRGTASRRPRRAGPGGLQRVTDPGRLPTASGQRAPSRRWPGTGSLHAPP